MHMLDFLTADFSRLILKKQSTTTMYFTKSQLYNVSFLYNP